MLSRSPPCSRHRGRYPYAYHIIYFIHFFQLVGICHGGDYTGRLSHRDTCPEGSYLVVYNVDGSLHESIGA